MNRNHLKCIPLSAIPEYGLNVCPKCGEKPLLLLNEAENCIALGCECVQFKSDADFFFRDPFPLVMTWNYRFLHSKISEECRKKHNLRVNDLFIVNSEDCSVHHHLYYNLDDAFRILKLYSLEYPSQKISVYTLKRGGRIEFVYYPKALLDRYTPYPIMPPKWLE